MDFDYTGWGAAGGLLAYCILESDVAFEACGSMDLLRRPGDLACSLLWSTVNAGPGLLGPRQKGSDCCYRLVHGTFCSESFGLLYLWFALRLEVGALLLFMGPYAPMKLEIIGVIQLENGMDSRSSCRCHSGPRDCWRTQS